MRLYRPVTLLVGVLFVLAAGVLRLLDPGQLLEDFTKNVNYGAIGQTMQMGQGRSFEITRVKLTKSLKERADDEEDETATTDGIFVAVEYESTGGEESTTLKPTLRTESGIVYEPYSKVINTDLDFPAAGFTASGFLIFEVEPDELAGIQLYLSPTTLWTVLVNDYQIDLAIPDQQVADQMIASAEDVYIFPQNVTRVSS
jgi:hypothetical protein